MPLTNNSLHSPQLLLSAARNNFMKSKHWSEFELIKHITRNNSLPNPSVLLGIGDDAAVISSQKNKLVITCDTQVENVHFRRNYMAPQQIGQRAIAVALSDIAAMGATPKFILTTLLLPSDIDHVFAENISKGLSKTAKKYDAQIIGGNITKSPFLAIDVFVVGESSVRSLTRKGANPDDLVCVTGTLGNAHSHLLKEKYYAVSPRIEEAHLLSKNKNITSMIDISDGLSSDITHICKQSNVGVEIFLEKLPRSKNTPIDFALHGGEDYELCFTVNPNDVENIINTVKKQTETTIAVIGKILSKRKGLWIVETNGERKPLVSKGWIHSG